MPPLDFDAPGATGTAAADPLDLPGEAVAVAVADEAAAEVAADAMPNLDEECGREIETADDSGHLASVVTEQSTCEVWACHDGTAWRYGLMWEHALGARSSPSRLMPGEGYSTASTALGAGLSIARMDLLGKDADAVAKLITLIDELEEIAKLSDEITDELQDRIDAGESEDMTPVHVVINPVEPKSTPQPRSPSAPSTTLADANEILRKIAEAEAEAEAAAREVEARKADLKDAKEDYEAAINRLRRLSRQIGNDASRPLLAVVEANAKANAEMISDAAEVNQGGNAPVVETVVGVVPQPPKDESWRECRFDDATEFPTLGSLATKLYEAGIETVGQLSDFQAKHGEFWAKEIKGIGKSKAEKISDAMIEFWKKHPQE